MKTQGTRHHDEKNNKQGHGINKHGKGVIFYENSKNKNNSNINLERVTIDLMTTVERLQHCVRDFQVSKQTLKPEMRKFFQNYDLKPSTTNNIVVAKLGNSNSNNGNNNNNNSNMNNSTNSNISNQNSNFKTPQMSMNFSGISKNNSALIQNPMKALQEEVQQAIKQQKTFTVKGNWPAIRRALVHRGWVEKFPSNYKDLLHNNLKKYVSFTIQDLLPLVQKQDLGYLARNLIKSKLLGSQHQVDFYWGYGEDCFKENPEEKKLTIINKFRRSIFSYTTKSGLCEAAKISHWFQVDGVSNLNHPRSYVLGKDLKNFYDDFYITAAISLIKYVSEFNESGTGRIISSSGKIPMEVFEFAVNECCKMIKKRHNDDIDESFTEASPDEWHKFLEYRYRIVYYNNHFKQDKEYTEEILVAKSKLILDSISPVWPYVAIDGVMNIWILKPLASSRGRGIHICRTFEQIKRIINNNTGRYVAQKYIERPLLIYGTKFDIRQWFLVSNTNPLTIWMYRESYLRFSSQTYNLRKLHESIHLTNNSVQSKYKNPQQDGALPNYNMWDSLQFQNYLSNIGFPQAFNRIIYPGMRQNIVAAALINEDKMDQRGNSFELYGADFMITEDFQPWLIEINASPALFASTPVTAKLCPRVLEDTIRVIIDYRHDIKASTGSFELIYKGKISDLPAVVQNNLQLKGKALKPGYFFTPRNKCITAEQNVDYMKKFGKEIKAILTNLLKLIKQLNYK